MAMFAYPGEKLMGGIMKKDESSIGKTKAGVMVYLYAKNIDEQIEVHMLLFPSLSDCWLKCAWFTRKLRKRTVSSLERNARRATMA